MSKRPRPGTSGASSGDAATRRDISRSHVQSRILTEKLRSTHASLSFREDFVCQLRFRTELPDVPCEPKMVKFPHDPKRFTRYSAPSFEREFEYEIHEEPDLGVPIDLIDVEQYQPMPGQELAEADRALLVDEATSPRKRRRGPAPELTNVSWLRRTTYIANSLSDEAKQGADSGLGGPPQPSPLSSRRPSQAAMLRAIDRSFADAAAEPRHPTNPNARPVRSLPVLPDLRVWGGSMVHVTFDAHPTLGGRPLRRGSAAHEERSLLADAALLRAHAPASGDLRGALYLHASAADAHRTVEHGVRAREAGDEEEVAAAAVAKMRPDRQYLMGIRQLPDHEHFVAGWAPDGSRVTLVPIASQILMRRAADKERLDSVFGPVVVRRRPMGTEEKAAWEEQRAVLDPAQMAARAEALRDVAEEGEGADAGAVVGGEEGMDAGIDAEGEEDEGDGLGDEGDAGGLFDDDEGDVDVL